MLPIYPRETHVGEELAGCQGPLPPNPSHPPLCGAKALGFQEQDGGGSRGWDSGETVAPPFSDHCRCPPLSRGSSPEQEGPAQGSTGAPGRAGCFLPRCPPTPSWCVLSPPLGVSLRRPGPARPSGQSGSSLTFPSCLPQPGQEGLPGEGAGERRKDPGLGCVHSGRQGRLPSSSLSKVKQPRPTCSQTGLPWAPLGKVLGTGRQADGGTGAGFPSPLLSTGAHSLAPALAPALAPRPSPPLSAVSASGH